eukprot:TRINITY_DN2099_c0_g1_i1.p1 TRINITY_DN2099_c0_g1~~TRINITY_DN2099_c0_g1_i1.p1  ORF type:complete len:411 (+),score=42.47 TRINITY_DN2099_c0_g1_i1:55-1233(+)
MDGPEWRPPPLIIPGNVTKTAKPYTPLSAQKSPPFKPPSLIEKVERRSPVESAKGLAAPTPKGGHHETHDHDEVIGETVGMLYAAINGVQRRGAGKNEMAELMTRVNAVVGLLKGRAPPPLMPPSTHDFGCQVGLGIPATPVSFSTPLTSYPTATPTTPASPPRRSKINYKHPIIITAGCSQCKSRMTKARWEEYPARLRREIAWAQVDLDSVAAAKREYIDKLVRENCTICKEAALTAQVSQPMPSPKRPLEDEPPREPLAPEVITIPGILTEGLPPAPVGAPAPVSNPGSVPLSVVELQGFREKDREGFPTLEQMEARPVWSDSAQWTMCGVTSCDVRFSMLQRKHHCRHCGYVFCDIHCKDRLPIPSLGYQKPQRLCPECYEFLKVSAT